MLTAVLIVGCIIAGFGAALVATRERGLPPTLERATLLAEPRALPEFTLVDASGQAFGRDRLKGHWSFLFFGFTNCPDICPTTLATLAAVKETLADLPEAQRPGVAFVSVDPDRDTPEVVGHYVAHFDPAFKGATGTRQSIESLTAALGVAVIIGPVVDGAYSVDHSAAIFLVDPGARVTALFGAPHESATIMRDYRRIVAAR